MKLGYSRSDKILSFVINVHKQQFLEKEILFAYVIIGESGMTLAIGEDRLSSVLLKKVLKDWRLGILKGKVQISQFRVVSRLQENQSAAR